MKYIGLMLLFMFPSMLFADCRVIESTDRNEVVCTNNNESVELKKNEYEDRIPTNYFYKDTETFLVISKEIDNLITEQADTDDILYRLRNAMNFMESIRAEFVKFQLNSHTSRQEYLYLSSSYLSNKDIFAALLLSSADYILNKQRYNDAKNIYRFIIVNFTEDGYKPYVKKSEFALEDIKNK